MPSDRIADGKYVKVTYSIAEQGGEVLEHNDLPVAYIHGRGSQLLPSLANALTGKSAGEDVRVTVPPAEGFGEHQAELTYTDDLANVPEEFRHLGAEVEMRNERGESRMFRVTRIEDNQLTVDGNHPLAGKTLVFTVRVVEVRDATVADRRELATQGGGAPASLN